MHKRQSSCASCSMATRQSLAELYSFLCRIFAGASTGRADVVRVCPSIG